MNRKRVRLTMEVAKAGMSLPKQKVYRTPAGKRAYGMVGSIRSGDRIDIWFPDGSKMDYYPDDPEEIALYVDEVPMKPAKRASAPAKEEK